MAKALKIHEQKVKCEQVHYRGGNAMNGFATTSAVFDGLV